MSSYFCIINNSNAQKVVASAQEVVELYLSGRKNDSLRKSLDFFNNINYYLFGKTTFAKPSQNNNYHDELEDLFKKRIKPASEAKWNEFSLAFERAKASLNNENILECGYDHTASFVDWFIYECGLIKKENRIKELSEKREQYLKSLHTIFCRENEKNYTGRAKLFYRNAYRAEMYSRKVYTDLNKDGFYDMYTPLILTRMGVEQYLKGMYENIFSKCAPSKPSECRKLLKRAKHISNALSNEIYAALQRGNVNTHEGYASYPFAIIHGIELLKYCLDYFDKNK